MSNQRLSEKNTNKYRKLFPDLTILKATTWGHSKALWCETGLFIFQDDKLILNEDWNGFGHSISCPMKSVTWTEVYGKEYIYNPEDIK
jgi:hypothetical protein